MFVCDTDMHAQSDERLKGCFRTWGQRRDTADGGKLAYLMLSSALSFCGLLPYSNSSLPYRSAAEAESTSPGADVRAVYIFWIILLFIYSNAGRLREYMCIRIVNSKQDRSVDSFIAISALCIGYAGTYDQGEGLKQAKLWCLLI